MPLPEDVSEQIRHSLSALLRDEMASSFQEALRPLVEKAFRRGAAFGIELVLKEGASYLANLDPMGSDRAEHEMTTTSTQSERPRRRYRRRAPPKQKRATSGAVGRVVDLVLAEHPGSRVVEIGDFVVQRDPSISRSSVTNELRRKLGQRYRKEGVRWYRIGDPGSRTVETGSSVGEADLWAERPGQAA